MTSYTDQHAVGDYLARFVQSLQASGVTHAVICPGSRSTPLAMALHRARALRSYILMDERSAAFFALGIAKVSRRPVVLLSTSGTAAANFMPAIVEAFWSHVPLLVLTADRPPELRDSGAAQTIDQVRLYGSHAKWFQDMPLADGSEQLQRFAEITAQRAVTLAISDPSGPVHLNFPFREPLITEFSEGSASLGPSDSESRVVPARRYPDRAAIIAMGQKVSATTKGVIIAGASRIRDSLTILLEISQKLQWPIFADPLSNIRGMGDGIIASYDSLLRVNPARMPVPEIVLRIGAPPTSKALSQFLQHSWTYIIDGEDSYREPNLQPGQVIQGQIGLTLALLNEHLEPSIQHSSWMQEWMHHNQNMTQQLAQRMQDFIGEPYLYYHLPNWLRALGPVDVFVSNSMPVRDLDAFTISPGASYEFWANRGANGIDGIVSTALGIAAYKGQCVLITGDMAFYHDMNGLFAAKKYGLQALVIVINNDGGGIFSFLPQNHLDPAEFEDLFGTPHGLTFAGAAQIYDAEYRLAVTPREMESALAELATHPGLRILEWRVSGRKENLVVHQELWD